LNTRSCNSTINILQCLSVSAFFRPPSDQVSFGIKVKPYNCLNVKMGGSLFLDIKFGKTVETFVR
jgi:hypothetical protein